MEGIDYENISALRFNFRGGQPIKIAMSVTKAGEYLRTKVLTASPEQLRLMLFDGSIKFLEQGRDGLVKKDFEAAYNGITRCQSIILELINSLRPEHGPELCERLSSLYTFMYTRLVTGLSERDPAVADEVLNLLHFERETWQMLIERLAEEGARAASSPPADDDLREGAARAVNSLARDVSGGPPPVDQLVGGRVSLRG